ncbi:hypothetical protein G8764_12405 [Pseudomaricurvus alcaniphilus]|uniref:hypothetical protein n=1 Tax=Pseudomaricurvus alcaniphilus TaxID=1166482 RepID=UPI00140B91DF|nr:hypothetical protein [Pseudomaricurvus alcaniphilus]NHN38103.1 hypothetical protein [Pseudomaricurvus alcaniphilus]
MNKLESFAYSIALFLLLGVCVYLYWPGLNGIFLVDDIYNLNTLNVSESGVTDWSTMLQFVLGNQSGMLGRPVAMLSFLIDDYAYPGSVIDYRYTNLMIHCLCGIVIFWFVRVLLCLVGKAENLATQIALLAAAMWLLLPLNVSTTLYIIQRMTQLATLFTLLGLSLFLVGRSMIYRNPWKGRVFAFLGLYICALLAVLSKENGALIFGFALIAELTVSYARKEKSDPVILAVTIFPLLLGFCYFLFKWQSLTGSSVRNFSTTERLLTESRILLDYMLKIVSPLSGKMGLVHDDIEISKGLFSPITTLLSLVVHAILIGSALYFRKKYVWLFFGVIGFYVGHLLESTVIPLELYFEHRNYTPAIFIVTALSIVLWTGRSVAGRPAILLLIGIFIIFLQQRAEIWGNPKAQIYIWANEHPESIRAQTMYARSLIAEKNYLLAEKELMRIREKWPRAIHNDLVILNQSCVGNMSRDFEMEELYLRLEVGEYDGSLPSIFEETFRLYKTEACGWLDDDAMRNLFSRIYALNRAAHTFKAKVAFWEVEFYARQGNLELTIESIDKTFKHQKDSYVLFLKSGILYSAGLHGLALEEVRKAIAMERAKPRFMQFHIDQYLMLEERLKAELNKVAEKVRDRNVSV